MLKTHTFIVALVLGACLAGTADAQKTTVYSWTDAQGNRSYGDVASAPPRADQVVQKRVRAPTPLAAKPAPASSESIQPAPAQTSNSTDTKACQVARRNQQLLGDPNKNVLAEDGKAVMDPDTRARQLARAGAEVDAYCNVLGGG